MNDKDFKELFAAHRVEFTDREFVERVMKRLPARRSLLPELVVVFAAVLGSAIVFTVTGITPVFEQIGDFATAVGQLQIPSAGSIATVSGVLALWGLIGWSVAQAGAE